MNRRTRMLYERERDREYAPRSPRRYTIETDRYEPDYYDGGNVYPMYNRRRMSAYDSREERPRMGFAQRTGAQPLDMDEAETWVHSMQAGDGAKGGRWTFEETSKFAKPRGMTTEDDMIEFYAVMNMIYSDYGAVAKKHGITTPEFFADMAKAFIEDPDACPEKTAAYFENIVDG